MISSVLNPEMAGDGRCSPSDFPYQFHRLIMPCARCFEGHRVEYVCPC